MASQIEILVRAYRQLWRQEIAAIESGSLKVTRDGQDTTALALKEYNRRVDEICEILGEKTDA